MVTLEKSTSILQLKGGLIVSCQPRPHSALDRPSFVAAMATVAEQQGAVGVRIRGTRNIRAVRRAVGIPIVGIEKINYSDSAVYITPTLESVRRVHRAGAQIIAMDATERPRPRHQSLAEIIDAARTHLDALIMADVATLQQGLEAARLGVAIEGRGAFRRFKDVLSRWPELLDRWYAFSEDRQRGRARAWLAAEGYAPAPRQSRG